MTKGPGMGDNLYMDQFDISGDVAALNSISCPLAVQNTTSINLSANARIGLKRDGAMDATTFWNPGAEADAMHNVLKGLTRSDRQLSYFHGTTLGNAAASVIGKQVNYDSNRGDDGSLLGAFNAQGNSFGLEWGRNLTAGKLTQGVAGNGSSIDDTIVSTAFGWAAYLHLFAFTGTSITVKIQDSANDSVWADLSGATFTAKTAVGFERISAGPTSTATVRRYIRLVSTGTFSNAIFAVNFIRYEAAGHA